MFMPLKDGIDSNFMLTKFERGHVIWLQESGFSFCDIAKRFCQNVSTVHDSWEQWSRDGTASRRPGTRQPHSTTEKEDCCIRYTAVVHHTVSVAEIRAAVVTTVTQQTVRNQLLQGHL
ncbi:transposable element Tc1 transposase [Trichonephila clavipes]|nr:transposable element Tc1 transposase [Trichonephila clavipes]